MIEEGIAKLVQGDTAVAAIATGGGGFFVQLPEGAIDVAPTWTHSTVTDMTSYTLVGPVALGNLSIQIDCFARKAADVIRLGKAIDAVLSGYKGTLTDADSTVVQGIFRTNKTDYFDDLARTYRRMLEYSIWSQ
jgi:hypothetical protein